VVASSAAVAEPFRHDALLYEGEDGFLAGTVPFIAEGVEAEEDILVVVDRRKIGLLSEALGPNAAEQVEFADMADVGRNPARIIPAWHRFADRATAVGRGFRGIGEPIWPERTAAQLAECHRHEALLNVAFAGTGPWTLLCPYDVGRLDPSVVEEAHRNHPAIVRDGRRHGSPAYRGLDALVEPFTDQLPEPAGGVAGMPFHAQLLSELRALVREVAIRAGMNEERVAAVVLAANEVATNSIRYGGGSGRLRLWHEPGALVCEVRDAGHITEPLAGRTQPDEDQFGGRGLWMVNQLCDLVQIRSSGAGTVVRMHLLLED
jgi:anti-sigma regulatory factor (Ser/Thr protein kinase)